MFHTLAQQLFIFTLVFTRQTLCIVQEKKLGGKMCLPTLANRGSAELGNVMYVRITRTLWRSAGKK